MLLFVVFHIQKVHMDRQSSIVTEVSKYQLLRQRLLMDFPSADEETLTDTLEGNHRPPRDDSGGDPLGASG